MRAGRDAAERRARLALAAGRDDQHFALGKPHRLVEADRRREVLEVAGRLRDTEDTLERAAGDAHLTPGLPRYPADRLQPRGVGSEGGDQHAALCLEHLREKTLMDALFRSRGLVLEDVRGVTHQREDAVIADLGQHLGARSLADNRRLVDLPVARVEYVAERRLDQKPVAFRNGVRERDEADAERSELDDAAALHDVELDRTGEPLLLELAGDEPGREGRRVKRALELFGHVGKRADMVLMPVCEHDAGEPLLLVFDELEIGQDELDAWIVGTREIEAEVDHDPLAAAAVEIDVHADLARAAERAEDQFFSGNHFERIISSCVSPCRTGDSTPGW